MILLPRELPDLRTRMAEYNLSRFGPVMIEHHATSAAPDLSPEDAQQYATTAAQIDAVSFTDAALYYINTDMVHLLMQAKDGIGETGFMEYDLPTPVGMAYLDADLLSFPVMAKADVAADVWKEFHAKFPHYMDKDGDFRAPERLLLLWRYMPPQEEYPHGWVRVAWYEDRDYVTTKMGLTWSIAEDGPLDTDKLRSRLGPFVFDGHQVIACHPDASELKVDRFDTGEEWREHRGDMFRALCFLLRQRVAETETVMPDRAARRRAQREGKEPPPVRVISIRGVGTGGTGDGQREYHHRWIVRGHWRMQPCGPNRSLRRPTWVTPYVKGPDDAPLLGGEKVYSVRSARA